MATRNDDVNGTTVSRDNNDNESGTADEAAQPAPWWYFCDGSSCTRKVPRHEERYKCQECQDFDYCRKCVVDAALIHPGHHFTKIDAPGPVPPTDGDGATAVSETEESPWEPTCPSCAPVTKLLPLLPFVLDPERYPGRKRMCIKWQLRLSYLIEATQRDCAFCCFFLHTFFRSSNMEVHFYTEKTPWYAKPSAHAEERAELVEHCMGTLSRLKTDRFDFEVAPTCSRKGANLWDFDKILFSLAESTLDRHTKKEMNEARVFHSAGAINAERYVCAVQSDPASQHISSRPPNPSPASPDGVQQIKAWLRDCEQNHGATCQHSTKGALPSRLIDVSDPDTLRLHHTNPSQAGQPLRYAALSYCWGGPQLLETTSSTLSSRLQGFPLTTLPPTLRDAVRITQQLGLQYLWIDSLCIIQDDTDDKFAELARMSDIYKNAFLTIVAARACSTDEGFLDDRADPDTGLWKSLVPIEYPLANKAATELGDAGKLPRTEIGTLYLLEEPTSMSGTVKDPVAERAWCLQERVLSPRVVSYGRWPTWRCNRAVGSDGGFFVESRRLGGGDAAAQRLTHALATAESGGVGLDYFRRAQLLETWRRIVEDYTRRKLTLATDKLPAIAGVAKEISRITGMEYLAGLWKENLLQELTWFARTQEWRTRHEHTDEFPRAPTWSWASVNAPILYDAVTADAMPLARVISCGVQQLRDKSTYDTVAGGTVEIQGPFAELKKEDVVGCLKNQNFSPAPPSSGDVQEWYKLILEDTATRPEKVVSMDDVEDALPDRVFGLLLFERDWTSNRWDRNAPKEMETCYCGLLLREVEMGRYERIGAFWNDTADFLDQTANPWAGKTVVLV